jgi:ribosomal protein S3AE
MGALKKIIYNCKHATFLIEKRLAGKITFREGIELRIHLIGCSVCKLYDKQTRKISEMVRQLFQSSMNQGTRLDDNFKKELQERIEEELNKN